MPSATDRMNNLATGQVDLTTVAAQLPAQHAAIVYLKGSGANTGAVAYGMDPGVTMAAGYVLAPGDESPPILVGNLNQLYAVAQTAGDDVLFHVLY